MIKNIKGFIFDLDGTLLDSMQLWGKVYKKLFEQNGLAMPDGYILAVNHLSLQDCADYTISCSDIKLSANEIISEWKRLAAYEYAHNVTLKQGARELLQTLRDKGIKLGVATALSYDLFVPCLQRLGIYGMFDSFTSIEEVSRGKNFPDIYLKACEKLSLTPDVTAVAEDSHVGVKSAKAGGFFTIGVYDKASATHTDEIKSTCDFYAQSLGDILKTVG